MDDGFWAGAGEVIGAGEELVTGPVGVSAVWARMARGEARRRVAPRRERVMRFIIVIDADRQGTVQKRWTKYPTKWVSVAK